MRYINVFLSCLMILFMLVQYNDPDGILWMMIYAVPALWCGLAGIRPGLLGLQSLRNLLLLSLASTLAGIVYYWPKSTRWWSIDVWYETETAREGMGMMVILIVLMFVWVSTRRNTGASNVVV